MIVDEIESVNPAAGWTEKTDRSGFSGTSYQDYTQDIQISGDTSLTLQLERLTTSTTLLALKETKLKVVP